MLRCCSHSILTYFDVRSGRKPQTGELVSIMKSFGDAKEGNVVTLDFVDDATKIGFDGMAKGSIAGEAFDRALTQIWLGEKPARAELKKAMLGG